MNNKEYEILTSKIVPKENRVKNAVVAFLVGGFLGFLGELVVVVLEDRFNLPHKDATSIMLVIFIFIASLLTAMGVFDNLVSKAKAGLIVPITGFAHAMTSAMIDYKKEGLVTGIGANAFKLTGSVILYGVVAAYIFGTIRYLFFGG